MSSDDVVVISLPLVMESTVLSSYHLTNCYNVFETRLRSDIEQTTRFLDVTNLQSENALNDSSMNRSPVDAVKEIVFASTERNMFSSSLNKSWSLTTTEGMDYILSTSTHRNISNPSNSNSTESRPPSSPHVEIEDNTVDSITT
jgi:hypothetical protein